MKKTEPNVDEYLEDLKVSDPQCFDEVALAVNNSTEIAESPEDSTDGEGAKLETPGGIKVQRQFVQESIILTTGRPVLDIKGGTTVLEIDEVESQVWKTRLRNAKPRLARNIPAVGRIELSNHPRGIEWLGTGWLIRDNIVVTNRHVAEVFASSSASEFRFRPGIDSTPMRANIDFLEEFDNDSSYEFPVLKVMHVEQGGGPDLAFLRIEPVAGQDLPKPVPISSAPAENGDQIAVIGYPARDELFPDQKLMKRIYNDRYDKKRLAPGLVTGVTSTRVFHDCSTLGGVSGGEIISLATGRAIALHFAGSMFKKNHTVPVNLVEERLDQVLRSRPAPKSAPVESKSIKLQTPASAGGRISATIPIQVNIELGDIVLSDDTIAKATVAVAKQAPDNSMPSSEDEVELREAKPEEYLDRDGYNPEFLGAEVPLPQLTRNQQDTLTYEQDGETREALDYRHFSVLMSRSRRQCRFSACNISGLHSKRTKRKGWRFDPRIPKEFQIMKECYGNPPKFSRGHMTRREDPAWGEDEVAQEGNVDSMHVTNAVPQIQPFNGGIWLRLEDYALQNAREDDMRISVFTGPFFSDQENNEEESTRFGIQVPVKFWKVIAFIHEQTGELTATGYTMSQRSFIGEDEFVFGQHENHQRPIAEIEARAGISFGPLAERDAMRDMPESVSGLLTDPGQITWL